MPPVSATETESLSEREVVSLSGGSFDLGPLMELVGNRRFVLLGEASHGSHEFYEMRARITRRLIEEKGSPRWRSKPTGQTPTG
jgi:erythromycin esterase-like protein